jgi:hypothetical protein
MLECLEGRRFSDCLHRQPTNLHYRALAANYRQYWMVDSDAVNSIDMFEAYLWFRSRGDKCLNCPADSKLIRIESMPLVFRVKTESSAQ